jgi:hypothetical protein
MEFRSVPSYVLKRERAVLAAVHRGVVVALDNDLSVDQRLTALGIDNLACQRNSSPRRRFSAVAGRQRDVDPCLTATIYVCG